MRVILVPLALFFGFLGLATPYSWHTLYPEPNTYGWNNTPVTVTLEASGGAGLQVCYILDNAGQVCQTPPVTITISSEGVHTLEYWAKDATGEESHHFLTIKIDFTPPKISVRVPAEDNKYFLHEKVQVDWVAYDRLSGLEFVDAPAQPGETLDTDHPGHQTFWVLARDRAGNTARIEVDYRVICYIETVLESGFYLDRLLPPEEQVLMWQFPVRARYSRGEPIVIAFRLLDFYRQPGPWTRPNFLLTQVRPDPEFGEKHTIWDWVFIPYDAEAGFYRLSYDTTGREPGVYDLWLGFGDGQSERIRVGILPEKEEGS